jgi:hypothetical protein
MAIPSTIEELSTTAASNGPSGSDQRNTADDGLRAAYAFIRMLVSQGSDVASASSITPASTGAVFDITGTTSITALASTNSWDGRRVLLQFDGALTLTHSSNLALPGSANITTAAGDVAEFVQRGSGAWRCINYQRADGTLVGITSPVGTTYTPTLTGVNNVADTTAYVCQYMRVGSVVTVSGHLTVDPTSNGLPTTVGISLPVASNFAEIFQCGGTAHGFDGSDTGRSAGITADTTNDRAQIDWVETNGAASNLWTFTFTYLIV